VDGEPEYHLEVLAHRLVGRNTEFLIKWKGYEQEYNSWEPPLAILENCETLVSEYRSQPETRLIGSAHVAELRSQLSEGAARGNPRGHGDR
jgi:Chromo (CHRromatin Organisation MOdifier) domain